MVDPFQPANPMHGDRRDGMWWIVAAVGIGVLLLAEVILFFSHFDRIPSADKAGRIFALLGHMALVVGLTLASLLQPGLSWGARTALLLGAAYFAIVGGAVSAFSTLF